MPRTIGAARRDAALRAATCLGLAVALASCAARYDPFRVPEADLRVRVRTVAIAPLIASDDVVDVAAARAQIEPLLAGRMRAAGFAVVPAEVMERSWRRAADAVGGVYDPLTGAADEERFEAVRAAVYRELRTTHDVDAVLYAAIKLVDLDYTGGTVSYCGRTGDPVYWPVAGDAPERTTLVRVLCLETGLYDFEGRALYGIRYGLEPVETYDRQTRAVRPIAERLRDRARITTAIDENLGALRTADR